MRRETLLLYRVFVNEISQKWFAGFFSFVQIMNYQ